MNIRKYALDLLRAYEEGDKYINLSLLSHSLDSLTREERGALTALLYTTVERKLTYDYYISAVSKRSLDKIDSYTRDILRLGLCQILDMSSIPDFAAVNETVKLARSVGERSFVNGVLRAVTRNKENLPLPERKKNPARYLSVRHSFPLPLVKRFISLYGEKETEELLSYFNTEKYTDLTVNTLKISAEDYLALLSERGIYAERLGESVRISHSVNPESLPGFSEGFFFVEDRASYLAVRALMPRSGESVVDTCSAPGGKAFASAILMGGFGKIHALDLHESKLSLIFGGAKRLGMEKIIEVGQCDGRCGKEELFGLADKVICDAPCSGLGVLSKKPDLRYKDESAWEKLPELQLEILRTSAKYLKHGGALVYSTCTLNPDENEWVVNRFLAECPGFFAEDFELFGIRSEGGCVTLLPTKTKTDGFFIARLVRK